MNDKDREAFEQICLANNYPLYVERGYDFTNAQYTHPDTKAALTGFKAALDYARKEQRELLEKCEEVIGDILDAPLWLDSATVPLAGVDANPQQVVYNASISYLKIESLKQTLSALHAAGIGKE